MRGDVIGLFKKTDEMEAREGGLISNVLKVRIIGKMRLYEQLCLNDTLVKINFRVRVRDWGWLSLGGMHDHQFCLPK